MTNIFSIKNLINQQLKEIISNLNFNNNYQKLTIELNQYHQEKIIYQTPYCLQIAKYLNKNPLLIADKIANKFNKINQNQELIAKVSGHGWLEFLVSDRLMEKYLNSIDKYPIITINKTNYLKEKAEIPFIKYYLHSRCCSLLISAHNQDIIKLNRLDFIVNKWQIIKPENKCYHLFYSDDYPEQKIIKEILLVIEKIKVKQLKINNKLKTLEEIFWTLESNSNIWGKTLKENRKLSQARLGLIGLILHCYQNIFHFQYQQQLTTKL